MFLQHLTYVFAQFQLEHSNIMLQNGCMIVLISLLVLLERNMSNYQNYVSILADKKCDEFPIILLFT